MKKEIVIIGGGVVGLSAAALLGALNFKVAVLDANPIVKTNLTPNKDLRVYAINAASQALFDALGAWSKIPISSLSPYRTMTVWDEQSKGVLSFNAQALALKQLGHIIEESALKNALLDIVESHSTITLYDNCQLESVDINDDAVFIRSSLGDFNARLIIGADGANSWLRKHLKFNCQETPYDQHAIVCNLTTELSHNKTAHQIFTSEGPLAFLPFKEEHKSSIVWSVSSGRAKELMSYSNDEFCAAVAESFQFKLGKVSDVSKRASFPLVERVVEPFIKPRALLVGDALHTIHPLAGLGVNLGLADVAALGQSINANKLVFDSFKTLRHYERSRKGQVRAMTLLMSLLKKSFEPSGVPVFARELAMNFISHSTYIKSKIISFATGL